MNRQFERYLQITLILLDLLVLNSIFFVCQIIFQTHLLTNIANAYFNFWVVSNIFWIIPSFILRTYAGKIIITFEYFTRRTIQVYSFWILLLLFYLFFSFEVNISRLFIFTIIISFGVGLLINRFLYLGIRNYYKKSDHIFKKVLILGYNDTAKKLTRYFEEDGINTQIIGFVEDEGNVHELTHYPVLSGIGNTLQIAKDNDINEIFSTITPEQNKSIYDLMFQSEKECIRFKIVPNLSVFITRDVHIEYFGDLPILSLRSEPLDDVGNRIKKRALDLVVSSLVIIFILSWMIPILGLLILLESRGPIFFGQLRTGKDKKTFRCLKFRSMRANKDADLKQATRNDSRVTRIGKFIRKTSLDEFPQFLNVFKGEMSLVGPRPHMLKHTDDYSQVVDDYMVRQFLKPGITGWAQINGYRGEITNPEQIRMRVNKDLWYLENWSLWLDIKIMFLTVYHVLRGNQNAF
ncbi:MAG TPA: undecaprenyl-phosphate glucose phosphotransferase [Ferruginibacter sp.]|nr:undecaprenyl-phosphate glucose phosphotransferase [Ferruginibacter sp.]HMW26305.1 undecaprenyl-phosphate glucose phosphotransferase [Ferruginibacter sp.]HMZ99719.1 undecaprenyl-phosphate glucose phosphotransferase [Ferruginibacter sp.]HNA15398.1 undecaprenyl-phosphate glucose phosphotransferase [Ferruginibacter sp.]HNF01139.1 undecaprenyl-phosphate glucose phosphotransferase [Ferruginibacter sp.]